MANIYLAGSSRDAHIIEEEAGTLRKRGHIVLSTWHSSAADFNTMSKPLLWNICMGQVEAAEACVVYPRFGEKALCGAIFEAGYALGLRKKLVIVAPSLHTGDWVYNDQCMHVVNTEEASKILGE